MSVALVGSEGQLGRAMKRQLGPSTIALDLPDFDITKDDEVLERLAACRPEAIVNCAAYTDVDKAEEERQFCAAVNSHAVSYLAEAAQQLNCPLIQISTDYVFGGDSHRRTPYREDDAPAPQGVYAHSKLQGERNAAAWRKHVIVRTSGLYGLSARRNNFVEAMLRLGRERDRIQVVDDQWCAPTYVEHLARAVCFLLGGCPFGIYHVVNSGSTNWYSFAKEIFRQAGLDVAVDAITAAQFGASAPRPAYSVLDIRKYGTLAGPAMPHWKEAIAEYLAVRDRLD